MAINSIGFNNSVFGQAVQNLNNQLTNLSTQLATDVHLKYRGAKIQGRNMPFDSFATDMDIVDGRILLHPVSIGVAKAASPARSKSSL